MRTIAAILDIANSALCTIESTESVCEAVARMNDLDLPTLLVVDERSGIVGLFTERDVLVRVVAANRDPRKVTVDEVMAQRLVEVSPGASLEEALSLLNECNDECLVVTERGEICGLISRAEISHYMLRDRDALINDLTYYITH